MKELYCIEIGKTKLRVTASITLRTNIAASRKQTIERLLQLTLQRGSIKKTVL
jgi:hypothetical protein